MKNKAKNDLIDAGFILTPNNKVIIPSLENYLKLSFFRKPERNDTQTRFYLFIGEYVKVKTLKKGDYIGDPSKNENDEGVTYLCKTKCDVCYVNKNDSYRPILYDLITQKYQTIFNGINNKFYIFKDISDKICVNSIVPLMVYKKYKKGEKIIVQNFPI